jgi:pilus assembly protein CpaE
MAAKILVVDDDPAVQRLVGFSLKQEGYDIVVAADGAEALRLWAKEVPGLIILDVVLPKVDGHQVAARIRAEEQQTGSHVPIMMLTSETEFDQRVRGMKAGADDYLVKPFHPAELMARIKSLLARFAPREMAGRPPLGRVLVFYGAKGGVGTTTIAINTAIGLHRELRRSVCLVDADLQFGDHRVFLDLALDRKSIVDAVQSPSIDVDLMRNVMVRHDSGVDLLLAPPSPETAELVTTGHVSHILDTLRGMYDYVIIDVDRRLDDLNLAVFDVAETLFVVMTADLSCLKNVRLVLETLGHIGYTNDKVQLILNRSNAFTGITQRNAEAALKRRIGYQVLNEYRGAISALNSGAPMMFTRPDSPLGRSLQDLARAIDRTSPVPAGSPAR